MTIPSIVKRLSTATAAGGLAAAGLVVQAPPAHALDYGFFVRGELVHSAAGGSAVACFGFFDDNARQSNVVVVTTELSQCYTPGAGGAHAPTVVAPGPAAATAGASTGTRLSDDVCAEAIFTYLDATTHTLKIYDTGLQCDDVNLVG